MPCLKIMTNLPKSQIPSDFIEKIIPVLAQAVKKDIQKFLCVVVPDCQVSLLLDPKAPAAVATLESIGNLGREENKEIMKDLSIFIEKELKIPPNRLFISFYDLTSYNIGIQGTTAEVLGE